MFVKWGKCIGGGGGGAGNRVFSNLHAYHTIPSTNIVISTKLGNGNCSTGRYISGNTREQIVFIITNKENHWTEDGTGIFMSAPTSQCL